MSGPGTQVDLHSAQDLFFAKHVAPPSAQQRLSLQLSPGAAQGNANPGVRLPSGRQLQALGSGSNGSGPAWHSALHIAKPESFS
mmetsp:Transcript_16116/g.41452  ORF Transcript_16116/g.41452 Transcript_16116/m.41452 type:complete len:84 (-) Transcript_16116:186-437(-)